RYLPSLTHVRSRPRDTAAVRCNGNLGPRDYPHMSRTSSNGAPRELLSQPAAERQRLIDQRERAEPWWRWGPYLSERQWGTVREDYSADGSAWTSFPHDQARSRAYRWGEDGLHGSSDNHGRLCFALALWNDCDPIVKERLFGL